jgi:ribosomal protein L11 methyltransferase
MQIEIAIEGPRHALLRLCNALDRAVPGMTYSRRGLEEQRPGIVILENEKDVDQRLLAISRIARDLEKASGLRGGFEFRVRNLAYSEPSSLFPREAFHPIPSVKIQPWSPGETRDPEPGTLIIDSGNAFGTGTHPSSRLCLMAMERAVRGAYQGLNWEGCHVLDFGCGTGLLAIGAVSWGAGHALGVEIDHQSVRTARKNVALNRLEEKITIRQGSWKEVHRKYDMILANLVPSVLLRTGQTIPRHLKGGGWAAIAGFGRDQMDAMEKFFVGSGLVTGERNTLEGWGLLVMKQPEDG